MKYLLCITYFIMPFFLLAQITLPEDGNFETIDSVTKYKNFRYHKPMMLGGYYASDSSFGKYLFFTGGYRNYRFLDSLHGMIYPLQRRVYMLCNGNTIVSTQEIPVDKCESFSKRAGKNHFIRNRRQLLDPSAFIFYGIIEHHEKEYQDQLYYKHNGIWVLIMPGPLPCGRIEILDSGRINLEGTTRPDKTVFRYRLIFRDNCYLWVRESPDTLTYEKLRQAYFNKNKNPSASR